MQVGRALHRHILREWYHIAKKGQKAPNPKLMSSDGATHLNLMDVKKKHRPLVVNFGSCSWPPFMAKLAEFCKVIELNAVYPEREVHLNNHKPYLRNQAVRGISY